MKNFHCAICRAAVRIYKDRFFVREIFCKSCLNSPYNMTNSVCIIVARNPYKDIRTLYLINFAVNLFSKSNLFHKNKNLIKTTDSHRFSQMIFLNLFSICVYPCPSSMLKSKSFLYNQIYSLLQVVYE